MSQTQHQRPKRLHIFLMKVILAVFVLIFAGVIGFNVFKGVMTSRVIASMPEPSSPVTALEVQPRVDTCYQYNRANTSTSRCYA